MLASRGMATPRRPIIRSQPAVETASTPQRDPNTGDPGPAQGGPLVWRERTFVAALAGAVAIVLLAIILWSFDTPHPFLWDEANYVNFSVRDAAFLKNGGPARLAKALLFEDPQRPPAYRIFALPITMLDPSARALRLASLVGLLATLAVVWRALRAVAGQAPAALGVALVATSPAVGSAFAWFGTEYPLFLATALLSMAVLDARLSRSASTSLTAVATGLGFWSKTSFIAIALPIFVAAFALLPQKRRTLLRGGALGVFLATPWWAWNWRAAIRFLVESGR
jgi:hypothetical protein